MRKKINSAIALHPYSFSALLNMICLKDRANEARRIDPDGLGLYFVKRVVEDHGGRVWAESEGAGKGSVFFVEIPLYQNSK